MATETSNKQNNQNNAVTPSRQNRQAARTGYDPFVIGPGEFLANPFSAMRRMHEEMDRVFSNVFTGASGSSASSGMGGGLQSWAPPIEVSEKDNQMVVCAELPGLKPEDVKVEVTEDSIVIEGERKQEERKEDNGRWHSERRYGHFYRSIPLPEGSSPDQVRAEFRNGELHVTVPVQQPQSKRRQVPINAGSSGGEQQKK